MRTFLVFALLLLPAAEIAVLITVGRQLGVGPVLLLLFTAAVVGIVLIRYQGVATLARVRNAFEKREPVALALLESVVSLVCGVLLVIPGFVTDAIALVGLIPPLRRALLRRFLPRGGGPGGPGAVIIEGEYRREEDPRLR